MQPILSQPLHIFSNYHPGPVSSDSFLLFHLHTSRFSSQKCHHHLLCRDVCWSPHSLYAQERSHIPTLLVPWSLPLSHHGHYHLVPHLSVSLIASPSPASPAPCPSFPALFQPLFPVSFWSGFCSQVLPRPTWLTSSLPPGAVLTSFAALSKPVALAPLCMRRPV